MIRKFNKVVGTGGIGTGILFHSPLNATLGRNESRLVTLDTAKDYCKQHIVFYYIATLLKGKADIYPIGCVGRDTFGEALLAQMKEEGMNTRYVKADDTLHTTLSICLQYPDKEGCNFTASNGAGSKVTPDYILEALEALKVDEQTMSVVIPEVSLESRIAMLRYAHEKGAFCALSVPAVEAEDFEKADIYSACDLIAVNEEEARAIVKNDLEGVRLVTALSAYLQKFQKDIMIMVTLGKGGAYSVYRDNLEFIPPYPARVVNTTGAGDAFLGGTVSGLMLNLPFQKGCSDVQFGETILKSAAELGTICAGMAIEDKDSIAKSVTIDNIDRKIIDMKWKSRLLQVQ